MPVPMIVGWPNPISGLIATTRGRRVDRRRWEQSVQDARSIPGNAMEVLADDLDHGGLAVPEDVDEGGIVLAHE
jgi:hypothetical protein